VVWTLHNYRLLCPNAVFFPGQVLPRTAWEVRCLGLGSHACYKKKPSDTGMDLQRCSYTEVLQTWTETLDLYIALTKFARRSSWGGFQQKDCGQAQLRPDPGPGEGRGGYALTSWVSFPRKGIGLLLTAWGKKLRGKVALKLWGWPFGASSQEVGHTRSGWRSANLRTEVYELMGRLKCPIFPLPSEYETFGEWRWGFCRVPQ